jgi:hypothetical protein
VYDGGCVARESHPSRRHLIKHRPEREQVCPCIEFFPSRLFRRHVFTGATPPVTSITVEQVSEMRWEHVSGFNGLAVGNTVSVKGFLFNSSGSPTLVPPTLRTLTSNDSFRMHRSDTGHGRHQGDKCLTISGELGATCLRANAEVRDRKAQRTSLLSRNLVP